MEVAKLIVYQARLREQEPAIAFAGGVATYGMLARAVLSAADRLAATGLRRGSIVAIDVRNPFHHVALIVALELCGLVSCSIQTAFSVEESGLEPAAVLTEGLAQHPAAVRRIPVDAYWFVADPQAPVDFRRLAAMPGFGGGEALVRVVLSSGTTGVPKSTALTSAVVQTRLAHNLSLLSGGGAGGVRLASMMGFSILGGYMQPIAALSAGGLICIAGNPADMLHLCRLFGAEILVGAVGHIQALLNALGEARLPSLRTIVATGSRMSLELMDKVRARLCSNVVFAYGSTEAGMVAQAPAAMLAGVEGAAGYVVPWADLQVVDGDDRPVADGEEGNIRVRTEEQAHYIVGAEEASNFRDGWFYPGDLGRLRADGFLQITGRSVEVIGRGGSMVAPDLVERVLAMRPEIREAAVFGVPGRDGIDQIWAAVVADGSVDEQAVIRFCREKLADKAPDTIRVVPAIPRTETGKIRRAQLRAEVVGRA